MVQFYRKDKGETMVYAMSDIHGCYNEYLEMLAKIKFTDEDTLFVLGDSIDRGYAPMEVLTDMMDRANVIPLIGNHELAALVVLKKFCVEITGANVATHLTADDLLALQEWTADGGQTTLAGFRKLSRERQIDILDYLGEFSLYEEITVGNDTFLMLHGGLEPFHPARAIDDYDLMQILFSRPDYEKVYFENKYTITGHTPTPNLPGNQGTILQKNNHIAIDCGCVFGYNLGAFCLDTGEAFYVPYYK